MNNREAFEAGRDGRHLPENSESLIVELSNRIEQLELELAESRKDQARYQYIIEKMVVISYIGSRAFVGRKEIQPYVDAAIKEQQ